MTQKSHIRQLAHELGPTFHVKEAAKSLNITPNDASKTLSRWTKQGWVKRVCRFLYTIVPLDAASPDQPLENIWLLVPEIFSPGYIGGWSAAEHWDFTEQVFQHICVLSEKRTPTNKHEYLGVSFFIVHIPKEMNFGTEVVWIGSKKVLISDPHKTILDMLYRVKLGGGIQHTIDCFKAYAKSREFDALRLVSYAKRIGNGVIFKRLGFICENILGSKHDLTRICMAEITKGASYIDPSHKKGRLVRRWQLIVPSTLQF